MGFIKEAVKYFSELSPTPENKIYKRSSVILEISTNEMSEKERFDKLKSMAKKYISPQIHYKFLQKNLKILIEKLTYAKKICLM